MIKEDLEGKKNSFFINDNYLCISIDYIYFFLSQKLNNLKKKLIILILLFAILQIKNENMYKYALKHLKKLNKNKNFINNNNYNIINKYNISKINGAI